MASRRPECGATLTRLIYLPEPNLKIGALVRTTQNCASWRQRSGSHTSRCCDGKTTLRRTPVASSGNQELFMQRMLTETEKLEIIEHEWARARAKNPKVIMRVHVQDE